MGPGKDSREIRSDKGRYSFFGYEPLHIENVSLERRLPDVGFLYYENHFAESPLNWDVETQLLVVIVHTSKLPRRLTFESSSPTASTILPRY